MSDSGGAGFILGFGVAGEKETLASLNSMVKSAQKASGDFAKASQQGMSSLGNSFALKLPTPQELNKAAYNLTKTFGDSIGKYSGGLSKEIFFGKQPSSAGLTNSASKMAADAARYTQDVVKSFDVMSAAVAEDMIAMANAIKSPVLYSNAISRQIAAYSAKFAPGNSDWVKQVQASYRRTSAQPEAVVAESATKVASVVTASADKIAIAQARIEAAQTRAATAAAVGANQIAASQSKAQLSAANTAAGITIANNRVVSSYAQTAANVIGSIGNIVKSVNQMMLSIMTTVGTMLNNVISAVGRVGGILGNALGAAGGAMGGVAGGIGGALQSAIKFVTGFGQSSGAASSGVNKLASSVKNVGTAAEGVRNPLTFMQNALSVGLGNAAASGLQFVVSKLNWMKDQFFKSTMDYQSSQVGLIGLLARELSKGGMEIGKAIAPATQQAKWLTKELSNLAIISPYMMKDVQQMFKESMAFGQSAMGAKQFTKDILNIAAGLGADNDMLQRMAYNFSQIGMEGSISALNMRQLAQAGFDLTAVIVEVGKATGVAMTTSEQFNDAITSGTIAWEDFDKALTTVSETQFSGAAERMARTLLGLQNNVKDFFNLTVPLLTLPAADAVAARANIIFDKFIAFRQSGTLEALGEMFGDWFGTALDSLGRFSEQISSSFGGMASDAFEWGSNLIIQFAGGIIDATGWVLDNAFSAVSNVISYWLSPGSPPNVAPGLRIWGAAALSEWLGGFAEADWGVFDGITKNLKSIFDLLGSDMYNVIGANLAQFLSDIALTGKSDIDIIAQITAATADFGAEMAKLVKIQLDYAAALKGVEDADKRIAAGESKQAALVREYNKMRKAGASPAALRAKGLEIEATKDEIYLAKKQKIEDEAKLELLKKQLDLQEKLVNALIDFAKQQEKMNKDADREREKAAKDTTPNTLPRVVKPSVWPDMTGPDMDKIKKDIIARWKEITKPLVPLQKKLGALMDSLKTFWRLLAGYNTVDIFGNPIRMAGALEQLLNKLNISVFPGITAGFNKVVDGFVQLLSGDAESAWKTLGDVAADVLKNIGDALGETWTNFSGWWENGANGSLPGKTQIGNTATAIAGIIGGALSAGWAAFSNWWTTVPEGGKSGQQAIGDIAGGILESIGGALSGAWGKFTQWWTDNKGGDKILEVWTSVTTGIGNALSAGWDRFTQWWTDNKTGEKITALWEGVKTGLGNAIISAWTNLNTWWTTSGPKDLQILWDGISTAALDALKIAFKGISKWWTDNEASVWDIIWHGLAAAFWVAVVAGTAAGLIALKAAWELGKKAIEEIPLYLTVQLIPDIKKAIQMWWEGTGGIKTPPTIDLKGNIIWPSEPGSGPNYGMPAVPKSPSSPQVAPGWYTGIPEAGEAFDNFFLNIAAKSSEITSTLPLEWSGAWDAANLKSRNSSDAIISDYNGIFLGATRSNEIMMPVQKSSWDLFWDDASLKVTTITDAITLTWQTMWSNIDKEFITRRDLLFAGWNTFWGTITTAWDIWTGSITTSWNTFWNTLRDNLVKWKEDNIDKLWQSGSDIIGAIIGGMAAAISGMTDLGSRIVNAVFAQALIAVRQWLFDRLGIGTDPSANMAAGGIATKSTIRTIGESGKEAVIPLQSARSIQLLARAFNQAAIMQSSMGQIVMPLSGMPMGSGNGTTYNQNLYVNTIQPAVNVLQSYESMRAYYGTY